MLNMMRVLTLCVWFLMIASCENGSEIVESDCPDVEVTDADRIFVAGQLANPNKLLLKTETTTFFGGRQLIVYYWKHFVFFSHPPRGLIERRNYILVRLGSDEAEEAYVDAVVADYEDPSDDYIIELGKDYNPVTTNEWVQYFDEAPRATDEEIALFESLYGCLGSDIFERHRQGITQVVVKQQKKRGRRRPPP